VVLLGEPKELNADSVSLVDRWCDISDLALEAQVHGTAICGEVKEDQSTGPQLGRCCMVEGDGDAECRDIDNPALAPARWWFACDPAGSGPIRRPTIYPAEVLHDAFRSDADKRLCGPQERRAM
jgi:hypothetical protein